MASDIKNTYPVLTHEATLRLETFLSQCIRKTGSVSFFTYMQHALYHPDWGYYTRGAQNIGRAGDFYTSVSVGTCFGTILAHRINQLWLDSGSPDSYHLIEIAANNGQLACDILDCIQRTFPQLYRSLTYHIIEHLDVVKHSQQKTLKNHIKLLSQHQSPQEISESRGIILSNELIDAFPVHLIQLKNNAWHQRNVVLDDQQNFNFHSDEISPDKQPELHAFTQTLPAGLPDGYQTEYRPGLEKHITDITQMLENFHTLTIDYGHTHASYYAPSRITGTLRCYHQHTADEDPLEKPGLKDITAHVDFTQLAKFYLEQGHQITHFTSQSHYLTSHAKAWLLNLEQNLTPESFKLIRQFQTLTHPTSMGHQFHVLETAYSKNQPMAASDNISLEKLELQELI